MKNPLTSSRFLSLTSLLLFSLLPLLNNKSMVGSSSCGIKATHINGLTYKFVYTAPDGISEKELTLEESDEGLRIAGSMVLNSKTGRLEERTGDNVREINENDSKRWFEEFNGLAKLRFSKKGNELRVMVKQDNYEADFINDTQESYVAQLLLWYGISRKELSYTNFTDLRDSGDWVGILFELDSLFEEPLKKIINNHATFCNSGGYRLLAEKTLKNNKDAQVFHAYRDLFLRKSIKERYKEYNHPSSREFRLAEMREKAKVKAIFSTLNLIKLSIVLVFVFSIVVSINNLGRVCLDWMAKKISLPTIFTYRSMPITFFEKAIWKIFGAPPSPKNQWDDIIDTPTMRNERLNLYDEFVETIEANRALSRKKRAQGGGIGHSHVIFCGPPGVGKSMLISSFGMQLIKEGHISQLIRIDGSDPSKLENKVEEVVNILNKLNEIALKHYIATGRPTIVLIDEAERCLGNHINNEVSEAQKTFTAKLLALFPRTNNPYLVLLCTTNLNVLGEGGKNDIDPAMLSRLQERIFMSTPKGEEGKEVLLKIFMLYFKKYSKEQGYTLDTTVEPFLINNIDIIGGENPTPRDLEGKATYILRRIMANNKDKSRRRRRIQRANRSRGQKNKKARKLIKISEDDCKPIIEELEKKQGRNNEIDYKWS